MIYRNSVCIYLRLEKEKEGETREGPWPIGPKAPGHLLAVHVAADGCPRQHFGFVFSFFFSPNFHSTAAQENAASGLRSGAINRRRFRSCGNGSRLHGHRHPPQCCVSPPLPPPRPLRSFPLSLIDRARESRSVNI